MLQGSHGNYLENGFYGPILIHQILMRRQLSLKTNEHKYNFCLHILVCCIAASLSLLCFDQLGELRGRKVQGEDEPSLSQGLISLLHSSLVVGELTQLYSLNI